MGLTLYTKVVQKVSVGITSSGQIAEQFPLSVGLPVSQVAEVVILTRLLPGQIAGGSGYGDNQIVISIRRDEKSIWVHIILRPMRASCSLSKMTDWHPLQHNTRYGTSESIANDYATDGRAPRECTYVNVNINIKQRRLLSMHY